MNSMIKDPTKDFSVVESHTRLKTAHEGSAVMLFFNVCFTTRKFCSSQMQPVKKIETSYRKSDVNRFIYVCAPSTPLHICVGCTAYYPVV